MLAEPGDNLVSDERWSFEPKLDGYRIIAFIDGESVYLQSRRGQDYTALFPELIAELKAQYVGFDDSGWRDRCTRRRRSSLLQRAAEPRAGQGSKGTGRGAAPDTA